MAPLSMKQLSLCLLLAPLAHAGMLWSEVCTQANTSRLPFCDMSKPISERVNDYVKRVSLADKAANMHNGATGVPDLYIPPYQWGSEGLHGPLQPCVCDNATKACKCPTSFPCPSALGTAFNDSLYFQIGKADGREARAINNLRNHVTQNQYGDGIDYWSPTLNMQRDPRWGRNQEVPGEDPMLTGNYAANFVQGLQGDVDGLDGDHKQILACCKHFIANSLENWENFSRHDFDAVVTNADMHNYYLPPFRSCVQEGRSKGVMCSYNAVTIPGMYKNVPSCANDWLLQTTLRDSWGFDGYVTSDCGAISNECTKEPEGHGVFNCTEATAKSIQAGTDVDCGPQYSSQIVDAVNAGLLTETQVDVSFTRLTTMQMELGLFDNNKDKQPYFNLGIDDIDSADHQQLALEAAQQALVLLKNDKSVLPLASGSKSIAIVGPHFNATELLISNYHGARCLDPNPTPGVPGSGKNYDCITSPLEAITAANGGKVTGSPGASVDNNDTSQIAAAVQVAKAADVVILAVGLDQSQEREGHDRSITTLPGAQTELVSQILALKKTTIMILFSGGAMSLGPLKDEIPAIIAANYGGEKGAVALADVLFGKYNPSGKLAATMYPPNYVNEIPLTEMGLSVGPGRTHMFYTGKPEFAFATGLSYSDWQVSWSESDTGSDVVFSLSDTTNNAVKLDIQIENSGKYEGRQTVLMFWRPKNVTCTTTAKVQQKLVGYRGTGSILKPSESTTLNFEVTHDMLGLVHDDSLSDEKIVAEGTYELFVQHGTATEKLHRTIRVVA